jgi:tRNA threonylcarbamoyladenosine biosynthesis protein TsaB
MILVFDTSTENVLIGLWNEEESFWAKKEEFVGGRELNSLIIEKLDRILPPHDEKKLVLRGVIIAAGPGSFTGLRIGMSVANTIAYIRDLPIVAPVETASIENLLQKGLKMLKSAGPQFDGVVTPYYGAEPHITTPKS